MHVIDACFRRLSEYPVNYLLGRIGAYVLWDSKAKARPSYIGEGNILNRLVMEHAERFALPLDGYAAPLDGSAQRAKADAEIVETLLLRVACDTDREPSVDVAPGKLRSIDAIFRSHGTLRLNVRGFDPLVPPRAARPLPDAKQIVVRDAGKGTAFIEHDWQRRRRMK